MKRISLTILLAMMPLVNMPAQGASPSIFRYNLEGAGGEMSFFGGTQFYSISFSETATKGKDKSEGGMLSFFVCTFTPPGSTGGSSIACINGNGAVPGDAITKVAQPNSPAASISIKIPNLAALPGFFIDSCDAFGCHPILPPEVFPISVTLRSANLQTIEEDTTQRSEFKYPDGTVVRQTFRGHQLRTFAFGTGVVGSIALEPSMFGQIFEFRSAFRDMTFTKPIK
jgi:hypothetical protein